MILCVEDDIGIRDLMIYTLNSAGFEAKGLNCGDELLDAIKEERPQLIMLDIMLPGEDGIHEILREAKNSSEDFRQKYKAFAGKYLSQKA